MVKLLHACVLLSIMAARIYRGITVSGQTGNMACFSY
uniref:Uncharacterized protein n=1 Tax=Setaria viridis TaxID=4556 RepID=A0A4U6W707_SETVI|nr:hypothetical protein SEVIR_1G098950v2 [Setaria viridis]